MHMLSRRLKKYKKFDRLYTRHGIPNNWFATVGIPELVLEIKVFRMKYDPAVMSLEYRIKFLVDMLDERYDEAETNNSNIIVVRECHLKWLRMSSRLKSSYTGYLYFRDEMRIYAPKLLKIV